MRLSYDRSRCMDDTCHERETCVRWLLRNEVVPEPSRVVFSATHNPDKLQKCPAKIEA